MKISLPIITAVLFGILYFSCEKSEEVNLNGHKLLQPDLFPSEQGMDIIYVSNVPELMATMRLTNEGHKVVIIKDGIYELSERLWLTGDHLIYRSESGNRDKVVIKGRGMAGSVGWIFSITGHNFAVKDITMGEVRYHAIQLHGEKNTDSLYVQNVHFYDIRQQMIKSSFNAEYSEMHADFGVVENCLFEYSSGTAFDYYCGGIDVHHGMSWRVSNCTFKNINSPEDKLTEGAIHFWDASSGAIIENNTIINCDRGIMVGFDNDIYNGGIIRNNMVTVNRDAGIYLCNATDVKVYNNTIVCNSEYPNAIEYRFAETMHLEIINNLSNRAILARDNAQALLERNITIADFSWFKNIQDGNLHLAKSIPTVTNSAKALPDIQTDIDWDLRLEESSDIGADER